MIPDVGGQGDRRAVEQAVVRLILEGVAPLGATYAYLDGELVDVFGGIAGEEVEATLVRYRRRGKAHVSAVVKSVITASPHRVAAPCPYFGPCTGCQWQHIEYSHQLKLKRDIVREALDGYGLLGDVEVAEPLAGNRLLNYRNHARFTVRSGGDVGFVSRVTRRFVKIDSCMLMDRGINQALGKLQGHCGETSQLAVRFGVNTGECLIQPRLRDGSISLKSGQGHYRERLGDQTFRISSPAFFQSNTPMTEQLAALVRDRLHLKRSETLVDAYAGVGTFSVLLAPQVSRVIAIEESAAAVKDAAVNTLGIDNLEFRLGRTEDVLDELEEVPDAVILDPPRVGCDRKTLDALCRRPPGRIAYVSCEPSTLARDLQVLVESGFRVRLVEPVDMFPQTHHVECVAMLAGPR